MQKHIWTFLLASSISINSLQGASSILSPSDNSNLVINNRVLAHVNDKAITVMDVMKKMDMIFLKQYPEYTNSPQARIQFYQMSWKHVLQELIDKELILADALENKVPITSGDVRQEMESLFGPNIIENLDKIGLSYDEAFKILQGDLLIKRMMMAKVNSKALRSVTPQVIREAYEDFAKKNVKKETWHYQVASIRNHDIKEGEKAADACYEALIQNKTTIEQLPKYAKENGLINKSTLTVTDPLYHTEEELSDVIKNALANLNNQSYSMPIAQKSRSDKSTVYRIIFLKEKVPAGAIPYSEIENQLKEELLEKAASKESIAYLKKLRDHYAISENYIEDMIPPDFQPFVLK